MGFGAGGRWALTLLLALASAGCVSLTPAQQTRLTDLKAFVNTVTVAYGKPNVKLMMQQSPDDEGSRND